MFGVRWTGTKLGKFVRRPDRHLDCVRQEPDACVKLRDSRAQEQFLPPPPPKTLIPLQKPLTLPAHNHESTLTEKPLNPEAHAHARRHHRCAARLSRQPQDLLYFAAAVQRIHYTGGFVAERRQPKLSGIW